VEERPVLVHGGSGLNGLVRLEAGAAEGQLFITNRKKTVFDIQKAYRNVYQLICQSWFVDTFARMLSEPRWWTLLLMAFP
jgi:hypothetical protein